MVCDPPDYVNSFMHTPQLIELVFEITPVRRIKEVDFLDRALAGIGGFSLAVGED